MDRAPLIPDIAARDEAEALAWNDDVSSELVSSMREACGGFAAFVTDHFDDAPAGVGRS
ncbi:MAG: hypothetical protein ACYDD4_06405 [Acidimicrobiales bacterium]